MPKLTGYRAIEWAENHEDAVLHKHADPIEDAATGLSIDEAKAVAKEDESLIWCESTCSESTRIWIAQHDAGAICEVDCCCECHEVDDPPCVECCTYVEDEAPCACNEHCACDRHAFGDGHAS